MSDLVENKVGVHVMISEYTLCGVAWDAPDTEEDFDEGEFLPTSKTTVTCQECVSVIVAVRDLKIRRKRQ